MRDYLKAWKMDDTDVAVATGTFKPASFGEKDGDFFVLTRRKDDGRMRLLYGIVAGGSPVVEWKPAEDRSADQLRIHWTPNEAYSPLPLNSEAESQPVTYVRYRKPKEGAEEVPGTGDSSAGTDAPDSAAHRPSEDTRGKKTERLAAPIPAPDGGRSHAGMLSVRIVENAAKPKVLVDSTIEVSADGKFNFTSGGEVTGKAPIRVLEFGTRLTGSLTDQPDGSTQLDLKVELVNIIQVGLSRWRTTLLRESQLEPRCTLKGVTA